MEPQLQRSKSRILVVTDDVVGGGTFQAAYQIALSLLPEFDVQFSCQHNSVTQRAFEQLRERGIFVHALDVTEADAWERPWRSVYNVTKEIELIRASRPDLILSFDAAELLSFSALKRSAKRCGIPFVAVINVLLDDKRDRFGDLLDVRLSILAEGDALVFACDAHLRRFDSMLPDFEVPKFVIANSRPDVFFEPRNLHARKRLRDEFAADDETLICLTNARIEPHKGQLTILKALARLEDEGRGKGIRLLFAGTGRADHVRELQSKIVEYGLTDRVSMLGWRTDIIDLLDASDVFILPSQSEATSLAIIEAMAKGIAVVATGVDGILELVDESTGILLPRDEDAAIRALMEAMALLSSDRSARSRLAEAGRKKADRFRVRSAAARYKDVLVGVLNAPRPARQAPMTPIIPVGSALDFADPDQVWNFLGEGWSLGEAEGVWTIGAVSTLVLQTNARPRQKLRLVIELAPYLGPLWPSQETDVFVDDCQLASWTVSVPDRQAFSLDVRVSDESGKLNVRLEHHRAVSPLMLGLTRDPRDLGLFFYRISILPVAYRPLSDLLFRSRKLTSGR